MKKFNLKIIAASAIALTLHSSSWASKIELDLDDTSSITSSITRSESVSTFSLDEDDFSDLSSDVSQEELVTKDDTLSQDDVTAEQQDQGNSWTKYSFETAKWLGSKALSAVKDSKAYDLAKIALVYTASEKMGYTAINIAAEALAHAEPVLGPAAPAIANVIKGMNLASENFLFAQQFKHMAVALWFGKIALGASEDAKAYNIAELAAAYTASENVGYATINLGADVFALVATPVLGPVGPVVAGVIKGANRASEYVPVLRQFKNMVAASATKKYVLPTAVKISKVVPAAVNSIVSAGKSIYKKWFTKS